MWVDERNMSIEHWCNDTGGAKQKYWEKTASQCHVTCAFMGYYGGFSGSSVDVSRQPIDPNFEGQKFQGESPAALSCSFVQTFRDKLSVPFSRVKKFKTLENGTDRFS
jgi:hypothetical protein